jgi:hypothetical protein
MEKHIKLCECGSSEFITQPNSYDVYQIVNSELEFLKTEFIEDEITLFCRECGAKLQHKNSNKPTNLLTLNFKTHYDN